MEEEAGIVRYSPKEKEAGYVISDTVVVKEGGVTRYFYNAIDVKTRFAFNLYYRELTSANNRHFYEQFKVCIRYTNTALCANNRHFYEQFKEVYPFKIRKWQMDNGQENLKEFSNRLKEDKVRQLFSYPGCPKINAYVERYNRTLREEFINNNGALIENEEEFNGLLVDYLVYYNSKRPHLSLNLKTPFR
ncbi:MAG: integrase core domain-containing protein [Endomicrobium sp.]|jgi:putative transposase|nr:integrase core domain-containing protein [Endomicrobium sp.]